MMNIVEAAKAENRYRHIEQIEDAYEQSVSKMKTIAAQVIA